MLKTGIPWEDLTREMGCGSDMDRRRRLAAWQAGRTWGRVHVVLLARLGGADRIDWSRALVESSSDRAASEGEATGPSPVNRAKPGSKYHVITDGSGVPMASSVTAANAHDVTDLTFGRTTRRRIARSCEMHVEPALPGRGIDDARPGVTRWPVERTLAWLHQNRRLRIR